MNCEIFLMFRGSYPGPKASIKTDSPVSHRETVSRTVTRETGYERLKPLVSEQAGRGR
jgi:hypothetical protein